MFTKGIIIIIIIIIKKKVNIVFPSFVVVCFLLPSLFPWKFKLSGVNYISHGKITSMRASNSSARPSSQIYEVRDHETVSP